MKIFNIFFIFFFLGNSGSLWASSTDSYYLTIKFPRDWEENAFVKVYKVIKKEKIVFIFEHCRMLPLATKLDCKVVGNEEGYETYKVEDRLFPNEGKLKSLEDSFNELQTKWKKIQKEYQEISKKFSAIDEVFNKKLQEYLDEELISFQNNDSIRDWSSFIMGSGVGALSMWWSTSYSGIPVTTRSFLTFFSGFFAGLLGATANNLVFSDIIPWDDMRAAFYANNKELYENYTKTRDKYRKLSEEYKKVKSEFDDFSPRFESKTKTLIVLDMKGDDYLEGIVGFQ